MELWGWLAGYVLLFALLHVVLYYYYVRQETDEGHAAPSITDGATLTDVRYGTPIDDRSQRGVDEPVDDPDAYDLDLEGDILECRACGAPNESESTYTYCWNCLSTLGT